MIDLKNVKKFSSPFPHLICDDILQNFDDLAKYYPTNFSNAPIRMHKDLTYGDVSYESEILKSPMRNLHNYVYSKVFIEDFLNIFKEDILNLYSSGHLLHNPLSMSIKPDPYEIRGKFISKYNISNHDDLFLFPRLDFGLGLSGYGINNGGRGPHVDNVTRLISFMIFFTNQSELIGGEHRLYSIKEENLFVKKIINTKQNRMLASVQSNIAFHDVNPLLKGQRKAIYMSISCNAKIWKDYENLNLKKLSKNRK
tara:strand:+ start:91 stop:852 length:762 start_codon:yes stop_codon:yes gene_type:complete